MPQTLSQISRSILLQRSAACLIWLIAVVKPAACLWLEAGFTLWWPWNALKSVFSPKNWMYTFSLALLQVPVLIAHCVLVAPRETQPLRLPTEVARIKRFATLLTLKWTPTSWLRALQLNQNSTASQRPEGVWLWDSIPHIRFQHALGRLRGWKQVIKALLFVLALAISANLTIPLCQSVRSSHAGGLNDAIFGFIIALTFVVAFFARKQDVLQYSDTTQAYLPQLISRLPSVLQEAVIVITFAVLAKLMLYSSLHIAIGLPPQLSFRSGFASQVLAGSFCAVCWAAGKPSLHRQHAKVNIVLVVFTHRVKQFQEESGGDPSTLLIPALLNAKDALMQNAAFQDVCYLAEAKGQQAWRRKMVFAQDSGEAWQQIGTVCMDEVHQMITTAAAILPQATGQAQLEAAPPQPSSEKPSGTPAKWNAPVLTKKALILSAAQPSELRAWSLQSHGQRMVWSMRTLAAFAVTAATEDKKGVVHFPPQPDCPDLATIMATLLCALQVLQDFVKQVASSPLRMDKDECLHRDTDAIQQMKRRRDHPVFDSAFRLQDAAQAAVQQVIGTYGQDCEPILSRIAYQPAFGSKDSVLAMARDALQKVRDAQQQENK